MFLMDGTLVLGAMGLTVRVETEMVQKNGIISSVFVRSINQTIFEDREMKVFHVPWKK